MKKLIIPLCVFVALIGGIYGIKHFVRVDTGKVGVVYSMSGGVQDKVLEQGYHFVSPFEYVKEFTVGNEQLIMSKDSREGSKDDESFKVATSDNASLAISFQMSYRFKPDTVTDTYKKFKGMDGEDIVDQRVKAVLKSKISEVTTNYSMMDIYSGDRSKINEEITKYLNDKFGTEYGIEVMDASIIDVHPSKSLQKSIDARVQAQQQTQQAQAEQEKIKVENETELLEAQNAAEIEKTKAEAEASANRTVAASITDGLIRMKEAEAREKHGWITVQGADTVVTNGDNN